ncbi:glutaredoxin domain-containing protein, partial [Ralstonia solanacearum species complex bacterium RW470]|uniref:glutaredoxin domain-containing protein n=1 Tax=Ralstonia solanacearum species complex bacterium RW470 TaxID=3119580 RepID=UPI002FC2A301
MVTIFTTTTCPHCRAAKALLGTKDVNLVIWEVDLYPPEVREELSLRAGGAKSVPQIFLNDKHLPGGNSNLQELEKEGKLDGLLAESLADPPRPAVPTVT